MDVDGLERAERLLDLGKRLVGADGCGIAENPFGQIGAHDVEAVKRRLGRDDIGLAAERKGRLAVVEFEVLERGVLIALIQLRQPKIIGELKFRERLSRSSSELFRPLSPTDIAVGFLEHAFHMRIIDASTENGGDGGDGSLEGTDKLSTSVTNRACIAAGKAAKSGAQYWTHRDLKASKFPSPLVRRSPGGSAELLCGSANDGLPVLGIDGPSAFTRFSRYACESTVVTAGSVGSAACPAMSVTGAIDRADFSSSPAAAATANSNRWS
jgi:hypothetical protein